MRVQQIGPPKNSGNVIDKTIQNTFLKKPKNLFKNIKNTNQDLANTKTFNTTDNFTSTCFEYPKNEKNENPKGKTHVGG